MATRRGRFYVVIYEGRDPVTGKELCLQWPDIDFRRKRIGLNRGLVAVGYDLHQTRGKTRAARRSIDLDTTTMTVLAGWQAFQAAEIAAVGITNDEAWVFTDGDGSPIHPHACTSRSSASSPTRRSRR